MRSLFTITVLPVSIGMLIHRYLSRLKAGIEMPYKWITIVLLLAIIMVYKRNKPHLLKSAFTISTSDMSPWSLV